MTRQGILFVEDAVPREALGAGHPRGAAVLRALAADARRVAIVQTGAPATVDALPTALPANVEILAGPPDAALQRALATRAFDVVWAGRPHNLAFVERFARIVPAALSGVRVIYDAEAVFALREARRRALDGAPMSESRLRRELRQEFHAAHIATAVASVSEAECEVVARHVACNVRVLSYPARRVVTEPSVTGRSGALFVGNLERADEPNGESLRWLLREVRPLTRDLPLAIAGRGSAPSGWLAPLAEPGVHLAGSVASLRPLFASARMFVAPTRYAAGIPLKVLDAARHGVPVVATPLVAELMGWRDGHELLVASDAAAFAAAMRRLAADDALWQALSRNASAALVRDFAPERFHRTVRELLAA